MNETCRDIRRNILQVSFQSGHGHIPTCFSVVELLYAIYDTMRHDPENPGWEGRDVFILSKGHAALAHYCVLARFGYFDTGKIRTFGSFGSDFGCHADRSKIPGVEASTGSLGHGIGIAIGAALGARIKKSDRRVFTLIGDGESNEGSVWEAIMIAVNLGLSNLTVIYDNNRSQSRGLQIQNPVGIFTAFGCDAAEVDGHDIEAIREVIGKRSDRVRVVVANTNKGHGCRLLVENHHEWHRKSPTSDQLQHMLEELDAQAVQ